MRNTSSANKKRMEMREIVEDVSSQQHSTVANDTNDSYEYSKGGLNYKKRQTTRMNLTRQHLIWGIWWRRHHSKSSRNRRKKLLSRAQSEKEKGKNMNDESYFNSIKIFMKNSCTWETFFIKTFLILSIVQNGLFLKSRRGKMKEILRCRLLRIVKWLKWGEKNHEKIEMIKKHRREEKKMQFHFSRPPFIVPVWGKIISIETD